MNQIKTLVQKIVTPAVLTLTGLSALAQGIPNITPQESINTVASFKNKIQGYVNIAIGFIGLLGVIMVVYGAILYMTAGINEDNAKKAKNILLYGFIGIGLAVVSYSLVNLVINFWA